MANIQITLGPDERQCFLRILEDAIGESRVEARGAHVPDFRVPGQEEQNLLKGLLSKLETRMDPISEVEQSSQAEPDAHQADKFRIAVFAYLDDPSEVAEVLTEYAGFHPDDALRAGYLAPGLLSTWFPQNVADTVVRELEYRGIRASRLGRNRSHRSITSW